MPIDVECGKCGTIIYTMTILKPIKEVMRDHEGRCPSCGQALSSTDFSLKAGRDE